MGSTIYGSGPKGSRLGPIENVPAMPKDEVLPMTLQVHPELLADERTVEEYTWHMMSSPSTLIGRTFSDDASQLTSKSTRASGSMGDGACNYTIAPGVYLAYGAPGAPPPSKSLSTLQAWCCENPAACGGITRDDTTGEYTARLHSQECKSPVKETSWIRDGAKTPKGTRIDLLSLTKAPARKLCVCDRR